MLINPLPLAETTENLRSGKLPLMQFINELCDRIDAVEPHIFSLMPEEGRRQRLLHQAEALLIKFPDSQTRPPLFGIPVGVKDIFRADSFPTTAGSALPPALFDGPESSVVSKLKQNGALILGKTVSTEFAFFEPGPTRNPHNTNHTPGGSSSGSAAAVAAGITPLSLGSQTIGSITRPASYCGIYGFKPTLGRISNEGIIPFSPTADHVGFFTQDLAGLELACSVMVPDWKKNLSIPERKPTIGIPIGKYLQQADAEMLEWFFSVVEKCKERGFIVTQLDVFGQIEHINKIHRALVARDFADVHSTWFSQYETMYSPHSRELILEGRKTSPKTIESALMKSIYLRSSIEKTMQLLCIDLWLSPSALGAAPEGIQSTGSPLMNLPWTFLGVPTISLPVGTSKNGLPLGLQLAGRFGEDEKLVSMCNILKNNLD
jgi:Asp-tRNA(Asn)/Glu-tRNA(Gln) amidotransferase A subunit family amidase